MTFGHLALFLIGCISTRLLIAGVAAMATPAQLPILGYLALLPALGFISIYLFNLRETGLEVGGGRIWWNHMRPIHAALYAAFAVAAIQGEPRAWIFLLADVLLGIVNFFAHHFW